MKGKFYHICFTSHNEVLCRNHTDYSILFNCIVQAVINTNSKLLAYCIMSNHVHIAVCTEGLALTNLVKRIRTSYTQMFNHIYQRNGSLGDPSFYRIELQGRCHTVTALSYILRNPMHHNVCANPYDYPFSSINLYFRKSLSSVPFVRYKNANISRCRLVRRNNVLPKNMAFDSNGQILPQNIVENTIVESLFGSYNAFQYYMHRRNYEEWSLEQLSDGNNIKPISIEYIEPFLTSDEIKRAILQSPNWQREETISDLELCHIIDEEYLPYFKVRSYAQLTHEQKKEIYTVLCRRFMFASNQIARCLGFGKW